jgi:hypothetical protein
MDAQARKKAVFRARLNAQKKEKRIDSPLVRLASASPLISIWLLQYSYTLFEAKSNIRI